MESNEEFELRVSEDDRGVAYLRLPGHPGTAPGIVKKSVSLRELMHEYVGPDVNLDFCDGDRLIGIEVVG